MATILIVDDEESLRFTLSRFLRAKGHEVSTAADYSDALVKIKKIPLDLAFVDIILNDGSGIELLREIRQRELNCPVIMITGVPSVDTAVEAVRLGAFDYLPKPVTEKDLLHVTEMALKFKLLIDEKERYRSNLEAIFRSVKDPIITVDEKATVIELNEAAMMSCGFSKEAVGMPFRTLPKGCHAHCVRVLEEAISSKSLVEANRIECQRSGRSPKIITLSAFPLLGPEDVFKGVVMVFRDETRLVHLEKQLTEHKQFQRLVGRNAVMRKIYALIEALSNTQTTVLITGESGTGKELVAEALHSQGGRRDKPFIKVNCSGLPESLLESELFGHVKGAFTGAFQDRIGRFQKAHGGTLFLDEIGDLSPRIQAGLLRVLQEREFERVGDSTSIKVDVRVIAATNKNLRDMVRDGRFREDLYYRLKVVEITLPPLRERRDDIPLLVDHFRKKFNKTFSKTIETVSHDVMQIFFGHTWPGNVRELEHAMEHSIVLCRNNTVTCADLPPDLLSTSKDTESSMVKEDVNDSEAILNALQKTGGNKAKAARLLGIDRATLYRKMHRYNLISELLHP